MRYRTPTQWETDTGIELPKSAMVWVLFKGSPIWWAIDYETMLEAGEKIASCFVCDGNQKPSIDVNYITGEKR